MTESADASVQPSLAIKARQTALSGALVIFTLAIGLLCVLMLSCTLTQTRMSTINIDGVGVSIWKLDDIRKQWGNLRDQIRTQSTARAEAHKQSDRSSDELSAFDKQYKPARTQFDAKMGPLIGQLNGVEPALAKAMMPEGPVERIARLEAARSALVKAHPELEPGITEIVRLGEAYKVIDERRIQLRSDHETWTEKEALTAKSVETLQGSLDSLFTTQFGVKPIDGPTRTRIENALFELYSDGFPGPQINAMLVLPPEILTLMLVVSMGILGSALQMTHKLFTSNEIEPIGVYFLRLSVGAITALVIFIVAKAGVPIIADASRLGGDAPINPYFVSFLAIISGLMSDKAINSVQAQGSRFFEGTASIEQSRWARSNLNDTFDKAGRKPAVAAQSLGVSEATLDSWLVGKTPVPASAQKLIAAVLDQPLRDLFSDLPPEDLATNAAE
jgi:hypothetical protein